MHRQNLAPIPGGRHRIISRRCSLGRYSERRRDTVGIQRLPFQRPLHRKRPHRRRPHPIISDASRPTAGGSGDAEDGDAFWFNPCDLEEAKTRRVSGSAYGDRSYQQGWLTLAIAQQILKRHFSCAVTASECDCGLGDQERCRQVTIRMWCKEITADRCHRAHGRPADDTSDGMQKLEIPARQDLAHGDACADGHLIALAVHCPKGGVRRSDDRLD